MDHRTFVKVSFWTSCCPLAGKTKVRRRLSSSQVPQPTCSWKWGPDSCQLENPATKQVFFENQRFFWQSEGGWDQASLSVRTLLYPWAASDKEHKRHNITKKPDLQLFISGLDGQVVPAFMEDLTAIRRTRQCNNTVVLTFWKEVLLHQNPILLYLFNVVFLRVSRFPHYTLF